MHVYMKHVLACSVDVYACSVDVYACIYEACIIYSCMHVYV